jgi:hypothetical protein
LAKRERRVVAAALIALVALAYLWSLVLIVADGAPLTRLVGALVVWSLQVEAFVIAGTWAGIFVLQTLRREMKNRKLRAAAGK